jgi:hypothetical protein
MLGWGDMNSPGGMVRPKEDIHEMGEQGNAHDLLR